MASNSGASPVDHGVVAAHHAHEVAGGRRARSTAHPAVDHGHPGLRRLGPDGGHARRGDGADHDDDGTGPGGGQGAVGAGQHGVHLLVVHHGDDDDVGGPGHLGR